LLLCGAVLFGGCGLTRRQQQQQPECLQAARGPPQPSSSATSGSVVVVSVSYSSACIRYQQPVCAYLSETVVAARLVCVLMRVCVGACVHVGPPGLIFLPVLVLLLWKTLLYPASQLFAVCPHLGTAAAVLCDRRTTLPARTAVQERVLVLHVSLQLALLGPGSAPATSCAFYSSRQISRRAADQNLPHPFTPPHNRAMPPVGWLVVGYAHV
jgi:hypothetical protein